MEIPLPLPSGRNFEQDQMVLMDWLPLSPTDAAHIVVALLALIMPLALLGLARQQPKAEKAHEEEVDCHSASCIQEETWCPKLEVKDWREAALLLGCPWNLQGCESLQEVLECMWRGPLPEELQAAYETLQKQVTDVKVAKVTLGLRDEEHFVVVYRLKTGGEVFGGAPLGQTAGVDLLAAEDNVPSTSSTSGVRRRLPATTGTAAHRPGEAAEAPSLALPCLLPFYRIHNGFGMLQAQAHLPLVLAAPGDNTLGSCFYVYPAHALEPVTRLSPLLRFARVDRECVVCANSAAGRLQEQPTIVYVEKSGTCTEDDETVLSFVGDTVSQIAGHRVVPPPHLGGPRPP